MIKITYRNAKDVPFSTIAGMVMVRVEQFGSEQIEFQSADGRVFIMHHWQQCCEGVWIEDVVGDLQDLVGEPILMAEEVSNYDAEVPAGYTSDESSSWTFYKLATRKGYVDIRWFGSSNGYYSETADFVEFIGGQP